MEEILTSRLALQYMRSQKLFTYQFLTLGCDPLKVSCPWWRNLAPSETKQQGRASL